VVLVVVGTLLGCNGGHRAPEPARSARLAGEIDPASATSDSAPGAAVPGAADAAGAAGGRRAPDLELHLAPLGSWRPSGPGERSRGERRWQWDASPEVRVLVDRQDTGQVRVTFERCWSDLPVDAAPLALEVTLVHEGETTTLRPLRLHHHTRPSVVLRRSPPPPPPAPRLRARGFVPAYAPNRLPQDTVRRLLDARHPFESWARRARSPYDPVSEEYGQVPMSWTGWDEAGPLPSWAVAYLLTGNRRLWEAVVETADTSGNYAVHYRSRASGRIVRYHETGGLPQLNASQVVTLHSAAGEKLPVPDVAHQHSLVYLAALLTGERWYREELQAWHAYNLLTRPREARLAGLLWSGEIRATAHALRALLQLALVSRGEDRAFFDAQLRANLVWMRERFVAAGAPDHRPTGVLALQPFRSAEMLRYAAPGETEVVATWQHHVLAWVLAEIARAGYHEAVPVRDHVLHVTRGVWEHSPARHDFFWGNHVYRAHDWPSSIAATFPQRERPPAGIEPPVTSDYALWARAGVVAAVQAGQPWAPDALEWIDDAMRERWGAVPGALAWQVEPAPPASRADGP
jgi:hypothetical protein